MLRLLKYHKIPIISSVLIFFQMPFSIGGLIFEKAHFRRSLIIIGRIFASEIGSGLFSGGLIFGGAYYRNSTVSIYETLHNFFLLVSVPALWDPPLLPSPV